MSPVNTKQNSQFQKDTYKKQRLTVKKNIFQKMKHEKNSCYAESKQNKTKHSTAIGRKMYNPSFIKRKIFISIKQDLKGTTLHESINGCSFFWGEFITVFCFFTLSLHFLP